MSTDQELYDTIKDEWHANRETLPNARGNSVGLRNADYLLLARHGIIKCTTTPIPDGMVATGEFTISVVHDVATRVLACITEAEHAANLQAAFVQEALAFLAGNDGDNQADTVRFFTILQTMFPSITLPTTYGAALDAMNDTIEAAITSQDMVLCNRLQNQSRIAQDLYKRILEPNGWTGARLAQLAAVMQGGE